MTALLCNHAEVQNNRLYVLGGGIDQSVVPAGQPGPWSVSLSVGLIIEVPWIETNKDHPVHIALLDADGNPVAVQTNSTDHLAFGIDLRINLGRPPLLEAGTSQNVAWPSTCRFFRSPSSGRTRSPSALTAPCCAACPTG
ncbi:DUF6941 family protein [Mycobacterium florentinum]|uniref:DUF6941 family protein n=1 Tax=Mycobacterium florentinum TaxID=292462 RepID=UPI0021F31441|nr:hypothetical protein [Mycobacterium florentinum]MCV7412784.1 hypothetical protein [Mycobacterium florentinum]